jgi:hypothetical protein
MRPPRIKPQAKLKWGAQPVWGGHSCPPTACGKVIQAGNSCRFLLLTICALLTTAAPTAQAQRSVPAHTAAPHQSIPNFNAGSFAFSRAQYASRFRRSYAYSSLPFPFFGDSFNPDDIYSTGYPVASQPPIFLLQAARALSTPADYPAAEPSSTPQPLVIELQNGRYVKVASTPANGEPLPPTRAPKPAPANPSPAHDLPPALLVFRDGHHEEVRDYTIADGILYARGDYYTDGYWTKKIALATLNVSDTLQANNKRNVKFTLPSSPNEVITRP